MALDGLKRRIMGSVGLLKGKRKVDEETARELSRSLRKALLEADFNVRQSKELTERIERRMLEEEPRPGVKLDTHAMNLIYTELVRLLGQPREIMPHNQTILMVGLYGQGKTKPLPSWLIGGGAGTASRWPSSRLTCIDLVRSNNSNNCWRVLTWMSTGNLRSRMRPE